MTTSTSTSPLLNLPPELRDQIWTLAFSNQHVTPRRPGLLFGNTKDTAIATRLLFAKDCEPCNTILYPESTKLPVTEHESTFQPLLTCKQIYNESIAILYSTLTLHISNPVILSQIKSPASQTSLGLREKINKLTLYVHLTDDTRYEWLNQLSHLRGITFPNLRELTVHNHMRPPTSYDRLIDAIYLVGPLTTFGVVVPPVAVVGKPGEEGMEESIEGEESGNHDGNQGDEYHEYNDIGGPATASTTHPTTQSSSNNDSSFSRPVSPTTIPAQDHQHLHQHQHPTPVSLTLHFAYTHAEIMFESPFLGLIRTSDAIEEHEAVIRDVFEDQAFKDAAIKGDLNVMTVRLLAVARGHEQSWLEGLQRRRMGDLVAAAAAGAVGEDGDEDEDDEDDNEDGVYMGDGEENEDNENEDDVIDSLLEEGEELASLMRM